MKREHSRRRQTLTPQPTKSSSFYQENDKIWQSFGPFAIFFLRCLQHDHFSEFLNHNNSALTRNIVNIDRNDYDRLNFEGSARRKWLLMSCRYIFDHSLLAWCFDLLLFYRSIGDDDPQAKNVLAQLEAYVSLHFVEYSTNFLWSLYFAYYYWVGLFVRISETEPNIRFFRVRNICGHFRNPWNS